MKSLRDVLIASTVMPALLLAQCGPGATQAGSGSMRMAQAPGGGEPRREEPGRGGGQNGPGGGAPHQAPAGAAPHGEAPHAAPPRAEVPHAAPPRAEAPHAAPAAEPHHERAAPAAPAHEPAPRPAAREAEPTRQAPAAARPAAREREAEPAHQAPAAREQAPRPSAPAVRERAAEPARPIVPATPPRAAETPAGERRQEDRAGRPARAGEENRAAPAIPAAPVAPAQRAAPVAPVAPVAPTPAQRAAPVAPAAPVVPPAAQRTTPVAPPVAGTTVPPTGVPPAPAGQVPPPVQGDVGRPMPGQPNQFQGQAQPNGGDRRGEDRRGGISPGGAAAIGAAAGFAGGFLAATGARGIDDIRRDRREVNEGGVDYIREPGRTIVRDGDRSYVVHDENERFRDLGIGIRTERRGEDNVAIFDRPGGEQILTYTDGDGRMIRRVRRFRDGREFVLIDNGYDGRVRNYRDDVVELPDEPLRIPRDRFVVEADRADEALLYDTLSAPPVSPVSQRYTLDQVRYSPSLRARMRSVDVDSLNFDPGSWIVPPSQTGKLQVLGEAIKKAVSRNANEVFLVEGYTDATGNPTDNLSLSDRRAQSVATILTRDFGVPPENLTTQGYGQQYLKEQTQGSSRINRRVTLRRITPLIASGGQPPR